MSIDTSQQSDPDSPQSAGPQAQTPDQLYLFIERYWAPCILHSSAVVRGIWALFYCVTFCIAMWGICTIQMTPQRKKLGLQGGTDLMEYFDIMLGAPMSHRSIPLDIILGPDATRDTGKLRDLTECLLANEFTVGTITPPWFDVFAHWLANHGHTSPLTASEYAVRVQAFLSDETGNGLAFVNDVILDDDGHIVRSRMHTYFDGEVAAGLDPQTGLDAMRSVQQCTDESGLDAFPFCEYFATDWAEIGASCLPLHTMRVACTHPSTR
jgi:hypothetical protein|eukprot:COSAG06_NODE_727_length_12752_cov_61.232277_5_plen_267_part_00